MPLVALLALVPAHAAAQQGSVQVTASAQVVTGDPVRLAGQERVEPDLGVSWLQPGTRFGLFEMELRGTQRHGRAHAGRAYVSLRDVKYRGLNWTLEGGDAYMSPAIGEYKFSNLFTPTVTFSGASVSGRSKATAVNLVAGRATAWRNIFGTDPDTLDQTLVVGRVAHQVASPLEVNVRGSRIRTSDLQEFTYAIKASDQAGGGFRYALTSDLQLVGDGTFVSFRRRGSNERTRDGSGLVGLNWLHARGWLQVNAFRFSPGDMPTVQSPLPDRDGVFAASEYDVLSRLRLFAGSELFRTNLDPAGAVGSLPRTTGSRQFGGVRVQIGPRSTMTLRAEDGARISRPVFGGIDAESDTGSWTAEWQTSVGRFTGSARYARRDNVDRARTEGSYTQHDSSAQIFMGLSRAAQLFGLAAITRTDQMMTRNSYWQAGGGAQLQLFRQGLWMRAEGTVSRNVDLLTESYVPRESLSVGVNGQLSARTSVGINVYVDRSPIAGPMGNPWATRSMLRVTRSLPAFTSVSSNNSLLSAAALERGTGSIRGAIYADWNANGLRDADEGPLEGIPLLVQTAGTALSRSNGEFAFVNVPVGMREIALDISSLPVDYDPPSIAKVLIDVDRGGTTRVSFGLIPLGAIHGRVLRDLNSNGAADPDDTPIDGAVVVLDEGMRSEQARKGKFAFEAVRSGDHRVRLLVDSLPEGAVVAGESEKAVKLGREALATDVVFLVSVDKRPEIRRVFPGGRSTPSASTPSRNAPASPRSAPAPGRRSAVEPPREGTPPRTRVPAAVTSAAHPYSVQIAALNDPLRAREIVANLRARGYASYLVEPPPADPDAPFKVRVGRYESRAAAEEVGKTLERERGEKMWVVRER